MAVTSQQRASWWAAHGFSVFAWLIAALTGLLGWSYAQGQQSQASAAVLEQVRVRLSTFENAIEDLPTLDHRVGALEHAAEKMDDVVRRMETAVVRLEQALKDRKE